MYHKYMIKTRGSSSLDSCGLMLEKNSQAVGELKYLSASTNTANSKFNILLTVNRDISV